MSLSIGIVGLPNVGKSTLFNALLQRQEALIANYPFATIEPNIGIVDVPDKNLDRLHELFKSPSRVPATIKFYDIAGLVEGAHKGEGLGNQFLSHIKEVDAIVHLIRDFDDENVIRAGSINPEHDKEVIETELALADIQTIDKRIEKTKREPELLNALENAKTKLSNLQKINLKDYEEEIANEIKQLNLMSLKPEIYVKNVDESRVKQQDEQFIYLCAKTEFELASFNSDEKLSYLQELGLKESGLDQLIRKSYEILGLQTFYTAGEKEVRAWTIKRGDKAPQAAGVIHTDFERGFIKAEVVNIEDLLSFGGWVKAKEAGKVRLEGKEYVMHENDVVIFKFNV